MENLNAPVATLSLHLTSEQSSLRGGLSIEKTQTYSLEVGSFRAILATIYQKCHQFLCRQNHFTPATHTMRDMFISEQELKTYNLINGRHSGTSWTAISLQI